MCAPNGVDLNHLVACGNELFWLVVVLGDLTAQRAGRDRLRRSPPARVAPPRAGKAQLWVI
jgi:hypothetical protein